MHDERDPGQDDGGFRIGERSLVPGGAPYVIAEIGVNHNGDVGLARRMIEEASRAGADAVKFQSFKAEEFMADRDRVYTYRSQGRRVEESMFGMFKRLELSVEDHHELCRFAGEQGVEFLSSAADPESVDLLLALGVPAIKVASEDLINRPLLEYIASKRVPTILSTGMADEREIDEALQVFQAAEAPRPLMLHCVSLYPTPDDEANLLRIRTMQDRYGAPVGFSDHTTGIDAALGATALGAVLIEKHFTLDRGLPGPDQETSLDPVGLARLVQGVRRVARMRGSPRLEPSPGEMDARLDFRRSIVAACAIPAGTVVQKEMLCLKRPGTGIHPRHLDALVGRRAVRDIVVDEQVEWSALQEIEEAAAEPAAKEPTRPSARAALGGRHG